MEFKKYSHLERLGNSEVLGIDEGLCYIFPKLDGTNSSVWMDENGVQAGSRNRHLSLDSDNAGFYAYIKANPSYSEFFSNNPTIRLYGEWLVPHSLKTYVDTAWRQFYVFDVHDGERTLPYDEYSELLAGYDITVIEPLRVEESPSLSLLNDILASNTFLMGEGVGEGIVIKNYDFVNKYGRVTWAKLISNEFKDTRKKKGVSVGSSTVMVEEAICDKYVTQHLVDKTYNKIANDGGWNSRHVPRLLQTVYYDLVNEECWNFIKDNKNPVINFKTLRHFCVERVKACRPDIF